MSPAAGVAGIAVGFDPESAAMSGPVGITAADLMLAEFPEPRFAVPGVIAEGLNFVAGAPKLGKSWWALGLGVAIASGGHALGKIPVEQGEVLYLALEDSPRRLQNRLSKTLGTAQAPPGLHFFTEWPAFSEGGAEAMGAWLTAHPSCRLVVVDVFARVRPRVSERADRYLSDYDSAQGLKALGDEHNVAVLAIHHTRKAGSEDYVDAVSGTHGLAAAADTIIVMKRSRGEADAALQVTGRDVEEQDLALRFTPDTGTWTLLGEAREWAVSEQRRQIIEFLDAEGPARPKAIAEGTGLDHAVVKHLVRSMTEADQISSDGNGNYSSPRSPIHPLPFLHLSKSERVNGVNGEDPQEDENDG